MGLIGFTRPAQLVHPGGLGGFECGEEQIDAWVARYAAQARSRGTAVVYVTYPVSEDGPGESVAGFYTISAHSVQRRETQAGWLTRNTPQHIPAILLGMLAVDKRHAGKGVGASLLQDAISRSRELSDMLGVKVLVVDALNPQVASFYEKFGFRPVNDRGAMALSLL